MTQRQRRIFAWRLAQWYSPGAVGAHLCACGAVDPAGEWWPAPADSLVWLCAPCVARAAAAAERAAVLVWERAG